MNRISQVLTIKHGVGLERQHSQCGLLGGWATTVTPPKNPRFWPWDHAHRVQNGLTIGHCWASIHPTLSLYTRSQLCTRNQFYNKINASYSNTAHLYKYFIFKSSYLHNNLKHYYSQIYLRVFHLAEFSRRVWHSPLLGEMNDPVIYLLNTQRSPGKFSQWYTQRWLRNSQIQNVTPDVPYQDA